jgi:DUF4097 and DUF4098 domain-containing protein YvlB
VGQQIEESETITSDGAERLAVDVENGAVAVRGAERSDIALDVIKQSSSIRSDLEDLDVRVGRADQTLEITSEGGESTGWFQNPPRTDIDAEIPRQLAVDRIDTSVGRVTVRDVVGDPTIRTSTGRIDVDSVAGSVSAETSTGRIEIRNVDMLGDVTASTGRIEAHVPGIDGDTRVGTETGRVELALGPDLDAEIRAQTDTGSIDLENVSLSGETIGDNVVSGTVGDGGPTLDVETDTGSITLTELE